MISPPAYSRDFLIYVAASVETIGMVLVQEDEELQEHVIYYLSRNLIDAEIRYSHVEKLALATVHAVQRLRHYILLCQNLVVAHVNSFQFVLTQRVIGGEYNKWIVILQEFDLKFVLAKSKIFFFLQRSCRISLVWMKTRFMMIPSVDQNISLILTVDPW